MEWILKVCGVALICVIAATAIKSAKPEYAFAVRIAGVICLFGMLAAAAPPIVELISELLDGGGMGDMKKILFLSLGIAFVTCVSAMICRECGEGAIADTVETAGKIATLLAALPLIREILQKIGELLD